MSLFCPKWGALNVRHRNDYSRCFGRLVAFLDEAGLEGCVGAQQTDAGGLAKPGIANWVGVVVCAFFNNDGLK